MHPAPTSGRKECWDRHTGGYKCPGTLLAVISAHAGYTDVGMSVCSRSGDQWGQNPRPDQNPALIREWQTWPEETSSMPNMATERDHHQVWKWYHLWKRCLRHLAGTYKILGSDQFLQTINRRIPAKRSALQRISWNFKQSRCLGNMYNLTMQHNTVVASKGISIHLKPCRLPCLQDQWKLLLP